MPRLFRSVLLVLLTAGCALLVAGLPPPVHARGGNRYFPETGFVVDVPILPAFERFGAVPIIGLPISSAMETQCEARPCTVQWFERMRLEVHHDDQQAYRGRIGADFLAQRGTPWQFGDGAAQEGCQAFAETGHRACAPFLEAWRRAGGRERLGLPITGVQEETYVDGGTGRVVTVQTQWFERAALEDHGAQGVLLRLLGGQTYPTWAERLLAELINAERVAAGLPPLAWHDELARVARGHSVDMATHNLQGHDSSDGRTVGDRLSALPLPGTWTGEVVSYQSTPVFAAQSLMRSPPHKMIMLSPSPTHLGAGYGVMLGQVYGKWPATVWTVDFWAMQ